RRAPVREDAAPVRSVGAGVLGVVAEGRRLRRQREPIPGGTIVRNPDPTIRVTVDPTNPGQFFACCGLLELADRLWSGAEGWFQGCEFCIKSGGTLAELIQAVGGATLTQLDPEDTTGSAIEVGSPFRPLRLDWWQDHRAGGKELKVW